MNFYKTLKFYHYEMGAITHQQYRTLRGQFGSGDRAGAERGLAKLLYQWKTRKRRAANNGNHQS